MSEKFDEFSKHLAQKHSRRGAFKLFGASIVGAAMAAVTARTASADKKKFNFKPSWNGNFFPVVNGTNPYINSSNPYFNEQVRDQLRDALNQLKDALRRHKSE